MSPMRNSVQDDRTSDRDLRQHVQSIRSEHFWVGAAFGGLCVLLTVLAYDRLTKSLEPPVVQMPHDVITAYNMGLRDAIKTNPPSAELEQVCVRLWTSKQN
jgi:hypothetical protein